MGSRAAQYKGLSMTRPEEVRVRWPGTGPETNYSTEFEFKLPYRTSTLGEVFDS